MDKNNITISPVYIANVSGGKDSMYMLNLILQNPNIYPLDGVVYFDLEIEYPFIKTIINKLEMELRKRNIPLYKIKPTYEWEVLYKKYGYPTRGSRWCNSNYKLDCKKQLNIMFNEMNRYVINYIGYCANEIKRFEKRKNKNITEIYPLVDNDIDENYIYEWAKNEPMYNNYYKYNYRCGCMGCPMSSKMTWAYLKIFYPKEYKYFIDKIKETEQKRTIKYNRNITPLSSNPKYNADYLDNILDKKYIPKLKDIEMVK